MWLDSTKLEKVLVRMGVNVICCIEPFEYSGRVENHYMRISPFTMLFLVNWFI